MDVDLACLIIQNEDLPVLFGRIGCLANMNVKIKDLEEFACWIHVISNPVVVKIYGGANQLERNAFKDEIVRTLRSIFSMTLNSNYDSMILSKNQMIIDFSVMLQSLVLLGAKDMLSTIFWG
jgi:hypothetical protein